MQHDRGLAQMERRDGSETLFDMANLFSNHTGLPFVVWISSRGWAQHDIRVKVSAGPKAQPSQMVSVAIRPTIRVVEGEMAAGDFALLSKWINLNHDVLLKYRDGEIDAKDAIDELRPIE